MTPTKFEPQRLRTERFGQYVAAAAREAGYDIDSPRGGGKKALAERAGMSHASVSRMLSGINIPDPRFFASLARALNVPLWRLLTESGLVPEDADAPQRIHQLPTPTSPHQAAAMLGIRNPKSVAIFEAMVNSLLDQEDDNADEGVA